MNLNKISFNNMTLDDLGDLSKLEAKDFELAAALFAKVAGPEIVAKIALASNKIGAIVKIVMILGPVIYNAYKKCNAKEKDYLDKKSSELKAIEEKCKDPNISEEEKELLAEQEAEIILSLQKRDIFKKWAKVAGLVFLIPFPANVAYYVINKKHKKKDNK